MKSDLIWEDKVWGQVCHIFTSPFAAVSILQTNAGFQCSMHQHRQRANEFHVLTGKIAVEIWGLGLDVPSVKETHFVGANERISVPSGVIHRFRVHESGFVVETYWPDRGGAVDIYDIIRYDEGGKIG